MLTSKRLRHWGDLDDRRRRQTRSPLGALPPVTYPLLFGLALGAWIAHTAGAFGAPPDPSQLLRASRLWLAAVIAGGAMAIFGAPFRLYWRRDSAMLARLPIAGDVLFAVGLSRSIRATNTWLAAPAIATLGFAAAGGSGTEIALRHLSLVAVAWCGGAFLGPATALAAGSIVASDKVEKLVSQMGGEFEPPRTGWLGILPGLAATGVVLSVIASADWALGVPRTAVGHPLIALAPPAFLSVLAIAWATRSAERVMLGAIREVAALDQERLAHIEQTRPSVLESAAARLIGRRARTVFDKDARLTRRRYPLPYFLSLLGLIALAIVAGVRPDDMTTWAAVVTAFLGVYGAVMARRRKTPPVEHPRFIRTLPLTGGDLTSAKTALTLLWFAVYLAPGATWVIIRAHQPIATAAVVGGIAVASLAVALVPSRTTS